MTITVWYCENCKKNNYLLDSNCTSCGRPYLRTKTGEMSEKHDTVGICESGKDISKEKMFSWERFWNAPYVIKGREALNTINNETNNNDSNKEYKDLRTGDYFIGKITIMELVEKYRLKERHISRIVDIYKYKTDGYVPFFHSKRGLIIGATYEIRGYMYEDGYLRALVTKELGKDKLELKPDV